jgi:hypothetical protein
MADPVHDLMSLAIATPDPRRVTNWISAYLGKRPVEAKRDNFTQVRGGVRPAAGERG